MKLSFLSNPNELKEIRSKIEAYCNDKLPNLDTSNVIMAVDEAIQNIIRYAYEMKPNKTINIYLETENDNSLKIKIIDYGKQVPLNTIVSRKLEEIKPGGLGVYFIKKNSKFCEYKHNDDGLGTTLTLIF